MDSTERAFRNSAVILPIDELTTDGYDMTWGTNTLGRNPSIAYEGAPVLSVSCEPGPFYFTKLLLPALFKASTPENKSRVINLSSAGSMFGVSIFGSGLDFATFKDSPRRRKCTGGVLYSQSKLVRSATTSIEFIDNIEAFPLTRGTWCSPRSLPGAMAIKS